MKKQNSLITTAAVLLVGLGVAGGISYSVLQHRSKPSGQEGTQPVAVTAQTNSNSVSSQESISNRTTENSVQEPSQSTPSNAIQNKTSQVQTNSVANSSVSAFSIKGTSKVSQTVSAKTSNSTSSAHATNTTNATKASETTGGPANSASKSTATPPPVPKVVVPANAASVTEVEQAVAGALRTSVSSIDIHSTQKYVTLQQADQMVWNWLKMSKTDAEYEPGAGSALSWGNIEGVNAGISDSILLHNDVAILQGNLERLMNKYRVISNGTYGLSYELVNDHAVYFQGSNVGPSTVAAAVAQRDTWYQGITVSVTNGNVIISIPTYSMNTPWNVGVQQVNAGATYSLDNGKTWITSKWGYASKVATEGGMANPPVRVLFKIQKPANGVWLMFTDSALNVSEFGRMMILYSPQTALVVE